MTKSKAILRLIAMSVRTFGMYLGYVFLVFWLIFQSSGRLDLNWENFICAVAIAICIDLLTDCAVRYLEGK